MNRTGQFFSLYSQLLASGISLWMVALAFFPQVAISMWSETSIVLSTTMPIFCILPFAIAGQLIAPDLSAPNSQIALLFRGQPSFLRCYAIDRSVITLSRLGLYWSILIFLAAVILVISFLRPDVRFLILDKPTTLALQEFFPQAIQKDHSLIVPGAKIWQGSFFVTGLFLVGALSQLLASYTSSLKRGKRWIYWGGGALAFIIPMGLFWTLFIKNLARFEGLTLLAFARHWPFLVSLTGLLIIVANILTVKREREMEYL